MSIFNRLAFVIFFIVIIFHNIAFSAEEKKRIAVLKLDAKNTANEYADIARDVLEISLHKSNVFVVLERGLIDLILKEQGFQMSGCTDTSCVVQIGKLLSADLVVIGSLSKISNYTITVKMVDISKGSITLAETEKAANEDDIESAIERIAQKLSVSTAEQKEVKIVENDKKPEAVDKGLITEKKQLFSKTAYGALSLSFIGISAALAGTGYYFDTKLKNTISDYDSLAGRYNATSDPTELATLRSKMDKKKDDADKFEKTRNILYGAGIGTTVIAAIFIYKYFSAKPASSAKLQNNNMSVTPVVYNNIFNVSNRNRKENFYGAGVLIEF